MFKLPVIKLFSNEENDELSQRDVQKLEAVRK